MILLLLFLSTALVQHTHAPGAPSPSPTPDELLAPTLQLLSATWDLFWIGAIALIAGLIAAYFAIAAYRLETIPALVISRLGARATDMRHLPAQFIWFDRDSKLRFEAASLDDLEAADEDDGPNSMRLEIRNISRAPVIALDLRFRAANSLYGAAEQVHSITALGPSEAVVMRVLYWVKETQFVTISISSATHSVPARPGHSKRKPVRIISEAIVIPKTLAAKTSTLDVGR